MSGSAFCQTCGGSLLDKSDHGFCYPKPQQGAPAETSTRDDSRVATAKDSVGAPPCDSPELEAIRKRIEDVAAVGEWTDEDAQQCFADRRALVRMILNERLDNGLLVREARAESNELREKLAEWRLASLMKQTATCPKCGEQFGWHAKECG